MMKYFMPCYLIIGLFFSIGFWLEFRSSIPASDYITLFFGFISTTFVYPLFIGKAVAEIFSR